MPKTPVSMLLSLPPGLKIISICGSPDGLFVHVSSTQRRAMCPLCLKPFRHVHSHYSRSPADLPCTGRSIRLLLNVRRFFCKVATCPRKVFTERLPELLEPSPRFTTRLRTALRQVGYCCGGKGGERLTEGLGMRVTDTTILWSIQLAQVPLDAHTPTSSAIANASDNTEQEQVRIIGIDDWSWRRGQRYGTIIVNLQTHKIIDLLHDRSVESVKEWLAAHPHVEIVSRDRGANYIEGVTQGAPQAVQVTDRWHLYRNLGDAVEDFLVRAHVRVPQPVQQSIPEPPSCSAPFTASASCIPPSVSVSPRSLQRSQERLMRKWELHKSVHQLLSQRRSLHQIAREMGLARNTVRKYARQLIPESPPDLRVKPRRPSVLDPYETYLLKRWNAQVDGCRNGAELFREIRDLGYRGGKSVVKSYVRYLRKHTDPSELPYSRILRKEQADSTSPRELRWLLARQKENLEEEQQVRLQRLLETSTDVQHVHAVLQNFHIMMKHKRPEMLDCWLDQAERSGIREMKSFAVGIQRDYNAVKAAIVLPWSPGQTEGQVNKLKTLKRAMYGRAGFDLLRHRLFSSSAPAG